jgi:hypothetical protein
MSPPTGSEHADPSQLFARWLQRDAAAWSADAGRFTDFAERLLKAGQPLVAHEVATEGLEVHTGHPRLRQLQALALARSGAPERANAILGALLDEVGGDAGRAGEETLGLLARTHKDFAQRSGTRAAAAAHLRRSFELYLQAFRASQGGYSGINAATLALLSGDEAESASLARAVRDIVAREYRTAPEEHRYYPAATLAEAALLLDDPAGAERWYREAAERGRGRFGDLASTRRNARLISSAKGRYAELVEEVLRVPGVGVLTSAATGWPSGEPGAPSGTRLRARFGEWLRERNVAFTYSSAAPGADLLFLEALDGAGAEVERHIVLPYGVEHFAEQRVVPAGGAEALERFDRAIRAAYEVVVGTEQGFARDDVFQDYADALRVGLARTHGSSLDTEVHMLVVGDSREAPDQLREAVGRAPDGGVRVEVLDLGEWDGRERVHLASAPAPDGPEPEPDWVDQGIRIAGILFADVYKYSALDDRQLPLFVKEFLGLIGRLTARSASAPEFRNTWGDGLYFLFADARDAGLFALEICEAVAAADWAAVGLREDLALRVGLHAGPVFGYVDPVTGTQNYTGKHTIRAARIEPVTPPGTVYASREFAAVAAASGVSEFVCEPVGRIGLAKSAANVPLFVVRRAAASPDV